MKPEWLEVKRIRVGEVIVEGVDILDRIRKSETKDNEVVKVVEEMKKTGIKMLRDEEWWEEDGLMLKEGKVYVPKDKALRIEVIRLHCCKTANMAKSFSFLFFSFGYFTEAWERMSHRCDVTD